MDVLSGEESSGLPVILEMGCMMAGKQIYYDIMPLSII